MLRDVNSILWEPNLGYEKKKPIGHVIQDPLHKLSKGLEARYLLGTPGNVVKSTTRSKVAGNVSGATKQSQYRGKYLNFDGTNDYINFNDNFDMGLDDISITMRFRTTDSSFSLFAKSLYGSAANRYYILAEASGAIYMALSATAFPITTNPITGYNDGEWHDLVAIWDRDINMDLWIDKVNIRQASISAASAYDIQSNYISLIGAYNDAAGTGVHGSFGYLNGDIDDFRFYRRVLTEQEIIEIADNPFQDLLPAQNYSLLAEPIITIPPNSLSLMGVGI